jgi:hypothetical protein
LVKELSDCLMEMPGREKLQIRQIKEKMSLLTVSAFPREAHESGAEDSDVAAIRKEISLAHARSASTCLFCGGGRAERRSFDGWIATACSAHAYESTPFPKMHL